MNTANTKHPNSSSSLTSFKGEAGNWSTNITSSHLRSYIFTYIDVVFWNDLLHIFPTLFSTNLTPCSHAGGPLSFLPPKKMSVASPQQVPGKNCIPHPNSKPNEIPNEGNGIWNPRNRSRMGFGVIPGGWKKLFLRGQVSVVWYQRPKFITCFTEKRRIGWWTFPSSEFSGIRFSGCSCHTSGDGDGVLLTCSCFESMTKKCAKKKYQCHNTFLSNGFHSVVDPLPQYPFVLDCLWL